MHGDWASVDEDGYWFLHGRSDDTLNIAGKRIGPAELESAAVAHPAVAEAAAVGVPHEVKGEVGVALLRARARAPSRATSSPPSCAAVAADARQGVRARSACCSSRRCRRRAARRSSAARFARRRSARTPATSRPWRTPRPWRRSNMSQPADRLDGQVALVTGGGRGIGANIARELADAGARVAVAARTRAQVDARRRARSTGVPLEVDVSDRASVDPMVVQVERELGADRPARRQRRHRRPGRADLGGRSGRLVARLRGERPRRSPLLPRRDPGMLERGGGRIVITGSGAAYLPGSTQHRVLREQGRVCRFGEMLAQRARGPHPGLRDQPGPRADGR